MVAQPRMWVCVGGTLSHLWAGAWPVGCRRGERATFGTLPGHSPERTANGRTMSWGYLKWLWELTALPPGLFGASVLTGLWRLGVGEWGWGGESEGVWGLAVFILPIHKGIVEEA